MNSTRTGKFEIILLIFFIFIILAPYIAAARMAGPDKYFTGFLFNPFDGNSYIAKMYEGWSGDWLFTLSYTAIKGDGYFLFIFYILLGHIARWTGLPLILLYHLIRLLSAIFMFFMVRRLCLAFFHDQGFYKFAMFITIFGSGMGWLALPFGKITTDFWVAEAYPFLSAFANPHFPLGIGLMIYLILKLADGDCVVNKKELPGLFCASLILAAIMPFGMVIVGLVYSIIIILWDFLSHRSEKDARLLSLNKNIIIRLLIILLGGFPILVYDMWVTYHDTLLMGWNRQNITLSPPLWDLLLSLSPLIFMSILGAWYSFKESTFIQKIICVWFLVTPILLYLPWNLQRRFITGIYLPIVMLGLFALKRMMDSSNLSRWAFLSRSTILLLIIPTNLVSLLIVFHGVQTKTDTLYLSTQEVQAFHWLEANASSDAVILCAPDTGLFIPAYSGRRVLYGHPYETVNAYRQKKLVDNIYQEVIMLTPPVNLLSQLRLLNVEYIFWGERERKLTNHSDVSNNLSFLRIVYQTPSTTIYKVID